MDSDKNRFIDSNNSNNNESYRRDSESSPGFDDNTSNSTLSAASPDPVFGSSFNSSGSRIPTTTLTSNFSRVSVESWAEKHHAPPSSNQLKPKPRLTPKIECHLVNYATKLNDSNNEQDERNANVNADKIDLPKIDISSRRELFENEQKAQFNRSNDTKKPIILAENTKNAPATIKQRLSHLEKRQDEQPKDVTPNKPNRYSGDFSGVRDRFSSNESSQFVTIEPKTPKIDVPVVPLKERLMHLESSMVSESPASNGKFENRTKKMIEPKSIAVNKFQENNSKIIDNNNESQTSSPINIDEPRHLKDDEDSGVHSDDLHSSLASQQSQPQANGNEATINNQTVATSTSTHNEKTNEPVAIARKPEVLPRRQITPDLVKVTSNLTIEDDLLQSQDEIDDEADNSVSVSSTSPTTVTKNFVNLTIKSVLVDSHDILKASSTLSSPSSTSTLVMENQSIERAINSGPAVAHNEHDHIVDNQTVDNLNLTVDVDPILTDTLKTNQANNINNDANTNDPKEEIQAIVSPSKRIYPNIVELLNNQSETNMKSNSSAKSSPDSIPTIEVANKSQEHEDNIDGNQIDKQRESTQLKNERIKCQIVGILEKNKIESPVHSNDSQSPITPVSSPSKSPNKSPCKTKNIFDFIKRNLLNESTATADDSQANSNETINQAANFYVSINKSNEIDKHDTHNN